LPYAAFLIGAAYNVLQTLDALGVLSTNFVVRDTSGRITASYWSPSEAMLTPFALLVIVFSILFVGFCVAGYCLGRRKGCALALAVWATPGLLSVLGWWPRIDYGPETFHVQGLGTLGSPSGMAALALLGLLAGWVCVVVATDLFRLSERFRHLYDHLWYSMAILTGTFFVADSSTSQAQRELDEMMKHVQQASAYLMDEANRYAEFCRATGRKGPSCRWADDVQAQLLDYTAYNSALYVSLGPTSAHELYSPLRDLTVEEQQVVRDELRAYNDKLCPATSHRYSRPSGICRTPPGPYCTGFDGDSGALLRTVAISNTCVIPTLIRERLLVQRAQEKMSEAARARHARWFFYTCFAFVAGGKVANASAKLSREWAGATALGTQRNVGRLFRKCGAVLSASLRFGRRLAIGLIHYSRSLYSGTCHAIRRIIATWRRPRAHGRKDALASDQP
jgi:hypothetical protein